MAIVFNGLVTGMRVVGNKAGTDRDGNAVEAGESWVFLSLEISDGRGIHSCQLSDRDPQYKDFVDVKTKKLVKDLTDHNVKAIVRAIVPFMNKVKDDDGHVVKEVPAYRIRVTNIRDEGVPKDS